MSGVEMGVKVVCQNNKTETQIEDKSGEKEQEKQKRLNQKKKKKSRKSVISYPVLLLFRFLCCDR